jgi:hypothetical protein
MSMRAAYPAPGHRLKRAHLDILHNPIERLRFARRQVTTCLVDMHISLP